MVDGDERPNSGSRPVPDPTTLTTEQLLREISSLKELTTVLIEDMREIIDEKFTSIDRQLGLVERQRVEQKEDTKAAVDSALTAQKEAVKEQTTASERAIAKSEAATSKQLEQLNATFTTAIAGLNGIINDLKDRVGKIEAIKYGGQEVREERRLDAAQIMSVVALLIAFIVAGVTIIVATRGG